MNRKFIGIEKNKDIYKYSVERINSTKTITIVTDIVDIAGNII
jgi:DNA modification methylase